MRWVLALALFACGEVAKAPDAAVPDGIPADSPPSLGCSAAETVCGNTCADLTTSESYCGSCTNPCAPTQACEAGACVPIDSCKRVFDVNPMAVDGFYVDVSKVAGAGFYCDFTNKVQYSALAMAQNTVAPAGYTVIGPADLTPIAQRAFIALFNYQGGMLIPVTFSSGNCCFGFNSGTSGIGFGPSPNYIRPAYGTTLTCNPAGGYVTAPIQFQLGPSTAAVLPLAADYFATRAPMIGAACNSDASSPGFFFKKETF